MFKHLLVPTDGSSISHIAENNAIQFAKLVGAAVTFIHVMPDPPFPVTDFTESGHVDMKRKEEFIAHETETCRKILAHAVGKAQAHGLSAEAVTETSTSPHQAIITTAERLGCDLIFMASHGRKGLQALLIGSETQKVLTHCKVPVLVYR
ncbi:MAG TPA: universal stress protein [Xanthomonadaceae bacterium]|nr:universal stress protein [Xanthomonadaceae bacterium]